jgi:prepilin-type N-terminal cleavage/methylation domain-containing protein
MAMHARSAGRGLTIIELLAVVAVVAVLAAIAAPSMRQLMMEQRLKSTVGELLADLQMARNTALTLRQTDGNVAVAVRSSGSVTCYAVIPGISDTSIDCDCTRSGADFCQRFGAPVAGLTPIKTTTIARSSGITIGPNSTLYLSAYSGITIDRAAKTLNVVASPGGQVNVVISGTGLPQICIPAGNNVSGYPPCS